MPARTGTRIKGVFFDLYGTLLILGNMKQAWSDWMDVLYTTLFPDTPVVTRSAFGDRCHQFFGKEEPVSTERRLTVFERRIDRLAASLNLVIPPLGLQTIAT